MSHRFFRASPQVYEAALSALDAAWGFPKLGCGHVFLPLDYAPKKDGLAYLSIRSEEAAMPPADAMLADMISQGLVEEVSEQDYRDAMEEATP